MTMDTLLFDLDGTLIDTNELIIQSFLHTLESEYPGVYTRESVLSFIGPPLYETFLTIDREKADALVARYRAHNHALHDELVGDYPGVYEGLKNLHEQGYKMAIVTTKIRKTALMGLELKGMLPFFDVVVGLDDVTHAKPHPEPIELALEKLGASKERAIMVGDNSHDIEAGHRAGVKTAAVGWAIKGEAYLRSFEPTYVLKTMDDLLEIVGANRE
ncbi:pyrophosphatase PpaX [Shouchella lonarensis]|uniref:Pyrophosphatase PpaX n=1 Tax=Shouchella lonarensis TaxID=1464122 RepID=A0A1G6H1Y9_9BACI|nr:pyrophosphatase PpaX [Shouchella lonarensis]SDB88282.1 pyrophosphatase PpaX [Shouchella lonarensis]